MYQLNLGAPVEWLRADEAVGGGLNGAATDITTRRRLCGEWIKVGGVDRFFTAEAHENATVKTWLGAQGISGGTLNNLGFTSGVALTAAQISAILARDGTVQPGERSQCFLGGAPELNWNLPVAGVYGGTSTTFRNLDANGTWQAYTGVVDPRVTLRAPAGMAPYLFPLHRSVNTGSRGVINVTGTTGISGKLVGRVTLHTTGTIVVLDDVTYGTNPATTGRCVDVLGLLSDKDVVVADNMLNNQTDVYPGAPTNYRIVDKSKDLTLHAVVMAINTSFRVQNFNQGLTGGNPCNGNDRGRGCLALLGGLIQEARGPVGTTNGAGGGTGFVKQYTYDRCANLRPPPYFPTTGRFLDNRYMEVDPVTFEIGSLMAKLTPAP